MWARNVTGLENTSDLTGLTVPSVNKVGTAGQPVSSRKIVSFQYLLI